MDPQASQSQDCEPTPPLQRHNSNFYLPPMDGDSPRHVRMYHPRHSPHAVPRYVVYMYILWLERFRSGEYIDVSMASVNARFPAFHLISVHKIMLRRFHYLAIVPGGPLLVMLIIYFKFLCVDEMGSTVTEVN